MKSKSSSKPKARDIASLLLFFLNAMSLMLVSELFSVDEMVRYHGDGAITTSEFKNQALLLLAVVAANLAACLISFISAYTDKPDRP